jgi:hypothetical protein
VCVNGDWECPAGTHAATSCPDAAEDPSRVGPNDGTLADCSDSPCLHVSGPNFYDDRYYDFDGEARVDLALAAMQITGSRPPDWSISMTFPPAAGTYACDEHTVIVAGIAGSLRTSSDPRGKCTIIVTEAGSPGGVTTGTFTSNLFVGGPGGDGLPCRGAFRLVRSADR